MSSVGGEGDVVWAGEAVGVGDGVDLLDVKLLERILDVVRLGERPRRLPDGDDGDCERASRR